MENAPFLQKWQEQAQKDGCGCVVGAVILNARGRAFVQKRSTTRLLFPGCWDIVGGHVEPGESAYAALKREIAEETGWQIREIIGVAGQFDWESGTHKKREIDLLVTVDGDLANPQIEWSKHSEYRWIGLEQIEMLKEKRPTGDAPLYEVVKRGLTLRASPEWASSILPIPEIDG